MRGYGPQSYGDAFASVYDDWYAPERGGDAVAPVVALVRRLAGDNARVLELGVGTGRLAIPMAAAGLDVHGVDASRAMLDRLRANDPDERVAVTFGDMVDDLPDGPFDVAIAALNTLFNLDSAERQAACFGAVARRLRPRGTFVVDAFVPVQPPRDGSDVTVRSIAADRVVLSAWVYDADGQRADGQLIELVDGQPVTLRPISIRYSTPDELDVIAASVGFRVGHRWADYEGAVFDDDSPRHVTSYVIDPP